jgi:predicted DCC family thiol-disulfide oxidoreductase YuxK
MGTTEAPVHTEAQSHEAEHPELTPGSMHFSALPQRWNEWLQRTYALDLRSLALFRIFLALLILGDLWQRARDLRAFYTDWGLMPRYALLGFADQWILSLHLISGMAFVQAALFCIAAFFAVMLLLGYRTRLFTALSWVMLVSLQNRDMVILQGGDTLFRMILFWSMFLPLGGYFSMDRALDNGNSPKPKRVFTVAGIAYMLQIAFLYWFAVLLKSGPEWRHEGTAVWYALSLQQFATPLGHWLLNFPHLLQFMTFFVFALEALAPVFFFFPLLAGPVRTVAVLLVAFMQMGFGATLHVGHFPFVSVICLIPLLPSWFWSPQQTEDRKRQARERARRKMRIYYDGGCPFCKKVLFALQSFTGTDDIPTAPAQDNPATHELMRQENSWIVMDEDGGKHFRSDGMAAVLVNTSFWPLGWMLSNGAVERVGDYIYDHWISPHRSGLTKALSPFQFRALKLKTSVSNQVLALAAILYIMAWNIGTLNDRWMMPPSWRIPGVALRLDQKWDMFTPGPLKDDGYYVIPGQLKNGQVVDIFRDGAPVMMSTPSWRQISGQYKDERWRKYLLNLYLGDFSDYRLYYGRYLCRKWNDGRSMDDPRLLENFEIDFYMRTNTPPGIPPEAFKKNVLHRHYCFK